MSRYADDLGLAHVLADTADSIALGRFRALDLHIDAKPDLTPVSDADIAVEKAIRAVLARSRPRDGVLGEEFGQTVGSGSRQWVIDPIDGTKNYIRGVPVWATLIALLDRGVPVAGLVSAPALGRRWWGAAGSGAFTGKQRSAATPIRVSAVTKLSDASFSYSSLSGWDERGLLEGFLDLGRSVWRTRGFGDFYSYMLLAEGAVDIAAEPEVSLWDLAALVPIVLEAGGEFTSLSGERGPAGGDALATNGHLHEAALEYLQPR